MLIESEELKVNAVKDEEGEEEIILEPQGQKEEKGQEISLHGWELITQNNYIAGRSS